MTAPSPGGAQRYEYGGRDWNENLIMNKAPDGDWVRYGDIAGMEKELAELRTEQGALNDALGIVDHCQILPLVEGLTAENARLRKALEKFGVHDYLCNSENGMWPSKCDCGLTEALRGAAGEA